MFWTIVSALVFVFWILPIILSILLPVLAGLAMLVLNIISSETFWLIIMVLGLLIFLAAL